MEPHSETTRARMRSGQHDLSPCRSVEENVSKARRAFFGLGSIGSFQGVLNPLTGLSVFEVFVIPILLYGCETWILTPALLLKLETKNFLTKITNDLVMATPIDSRKSRQTRNAINQAQSHPIEKCRI